ncbi:S24 family peptidase [Croceibacterium ferulae]|uniref:S24 family peptidase n=1 Tax=Croceibacterium ferulae TaxID=1854641 RepID=UPI000EB00BAD|nr:S24 family peptidase [Croceibacterium ferulae]
MHKIAQVLQTTATYVSGEIDDPAEDAFIPPAPAEIAAEMRLVKISEIDLDIGIGAAFMDKAQVPEVDRWILQEWVSNFTGTPAPLLAIARAVGESMYPTINDRELVLVARLQTKIDRADGICLLVFGGFSTIRLVRMLPGGTARLTAANPLVRDESAAASQLSVICRVPGVFLRT